jgi:hypothetical protein
MGEQMVTSFDDVSDWLIAHERLVTVDGFAILSRFHQLIDAAT